MEMMQVFYCLAGPVFFGAGGAWVVARYGFELGVLDRATDRSSHSGSVPKAGGIGILVTFICCSVLFKFSSLFWMPAVFLSLVSLLGDRVDLSAGLRFFVQIICSIVVLVCFFSQVGFNDYAAFPVLVLFIASTANIYNFMDGINGIAGITGVVAFGLLALFAYIIGADGRYVMLGLSMALSCLAFLYFNIPAARVFMGDVGSVLLGFVFASTAIFVARDMADFICVSGFLLLFYMDALTTMVVRLKQGESLVKAHRKHVYQLLANELGRAHWKISLGYGVAQLVMGLAAVSLRSCGLLRVAVFYAVCGMIFIGVANMVRKKVSVL